jgi:hypothetical protein
LVAELPFIETKIDKYTFIREFSNDVDEMNLVWHEDPENRVIEVIEGNGWKFQYDDQLPFEMIDGVEFTIIKGQIHRVIKGRGPLKIKVQKNIL